MAKEKNAAPAAEATQESVDIRSLNVIKTNVAEEAFEQIEKNRDEKQKRDLMDAICVSTYNNLRTRAELRARRREDDITKEKLEATKKLFERVIGMETEITKDGKLKPIKGKTIDEKERLTLSQYKTEKSKLEEDFRKKTNESDKKLDEEMRELRDSYEGQFRPWWD